MAKITVKHTEEEDAEIKNVNSEKKCIFAENLQDKKYKGMMFNERIKQLSEERQLPQRKLAEAMDIMTEYDKEKDLLKYKRKTSRGTENCFILYKKNL